MTVTASMGHLGTDVTGIGADGQRWVLRCHLDPAGLAPADVHRFADAVRLMQRGDLIMIVVGGSASEPVLQAAVQASVTIVDAASLSWWENLQA
ncbi:hypothetical protein ACQP2F_32685 [Actinoplanes sp. CA-030573]|uniref:hypothetical protein n=1 Tax=Actinoplanes sp. CA-030573 TaxID=3239898 RepID=UPI003D90ADAB